MPLSPFAGPYMVKPKPASGIPLTAHAFNGETMNEAAEPAQQGTQFDPLGHFASFRQPWDGMMPFPAENAIYYGGFTPREGKPTPDSPLLRLNRCNVHPNKPRTQLRDAHAPSLN